MIHNNQCEICREPTKRPVGFWDGYTKDGKSTGGYLYTCGNMECHVVYIYIGVQDGTTF